MLPMSESGLSAAVYERHFEREWTHSVEFAYHIVGDRDLAEDIVQEAFTRLWEYCASLRDASKTTAFVRRTVRNLALNAKRDLQRHIQALESYRAPPRSPTPWSQLVAAELEGRIAEAVQCLPPRRRRIFVLTFLRGLSSGEAAQELGIAPQTVANEKSLLRRIIRSHLYGHGRPKR